MEGRGEVWSDATTVLGVSLKGFRATGLPGLRLIADRSLRDLAVCSTFLLLLALFFLFIREGVNKCENE